MSVFLPGRTAAGRALCGARVPALGAGGARRGFAGTAVRGSKLGRTPISVPPGVEVRVGERWAKKDLTSYLEKGLRTVTVTGPLGMFSFSFLALVFGVKAWRLGGCVFCCLGLGLGLLVEGVGSFGVGTVGKCGSD